MSVPCWKVAYPSAKAAAKAAESQRHRISKPNRRGKSRPMKAYQCPFCGLWHLTSRTRTQPRSTRISPRSNRTKI